MLPLDSINQPDSVEKEFCIPFSKLPIEEMSTKDKNMFVHISHMMDDLEDTDGGKNSLNAIKNYSNIDALLQSKLSIKICYRTKLWLLHLCNGDMALLYLYLVYIQYLASKKPLVDKAGNTSDRVFVNFRFFCEEGFPDGFPLFLRIQALFSSVYVDTPNGKKNILEYPYCYKSIQFGLKAKINQPKAVEPLKNIIEVPVKEEPKQEPLVKKPEVKQNPKPSSKPINALDLINNPMFIKNIKNI